jgi:hypothetical protein
VQSTRDTNRGYFTPRFLINQSSTRYLLVIPNLLGIFLGINEIDSPLGVLIVVLSKSTSITLINDDIF